MYVRESAATGLRIAVRPATLCWFMCGARAFLLVTVQITLELEDAACDWLTLPAAQARWQPAVTEPLGTTFAEHAAAAMRQPSAPVHSATSCWLSCAPLTRVASQAWLDALMPTAEAAARTHAGALLEALSSAFVGAVEPGATAPGCTLSRTQAAAVNVVLHTAWSAAHATAQPATYLRMLSVPPVLQALVSCGALATADAWGAAAACAVLASTLLRAADSTLACTPAMQSEPSDSLVMQLLNEPHMWIRMGAALCAWPALRAPGSAGETAAAALVSAAAPCMEHERHAGSLHIRALLEVSVALLHWLLTRDYTRVQCAVLAGGWAFSCVTPEMHALPWMKPLPLLQTRATASPAHARGHVGASLPPVVGVPELEDRIVALAASVAHTYYSALIPA
ncbi:MAG: hypothetical protein EOO41_01570, partial [Methanobacteriota archaeon]